jgi:hypothetical protein
VYGARHGSLKQRHRWVSDGGRQPTNARRNLASLDTGPAQAD